MLTTNFNKPVAVNDTFNILIDIPSDFNVLANDFDGDGDGLTITELITPPELPELQKYQHQIQLIIVLL
ncbi:MAG: hypothetical protein IPH42_04180 [Bacteroidetes bacterium]|nr:hypothetical protein [Bacteroidota bacterium]